MDLLTHAVLGATAAATLQKKSRGLVAALGGVAALAPDLDVLIRSSADPLLTLQFHRHFTHSLLFAPIGALIICLLCWLPVQKKLSFARAYGACLTGYASACLLDACTSYGTHLFWPLQDSPVALSIIAVVDPLMTLMLLAALVFAWRLSKVWMLHMGVLAAIAYLSLGYLQQQRALAAAQQLAQQAGFNAQFILAKPTMGNLILWRTIAVGDGEAHINGIRVALSGKTRVYAGRPVDVFNARDQKLVPHNSRAGRDLQRFDQFAKGLLVVDSADSNVIGDLRYALLPNSTKPLWGIRVNPAAPHQPVEFVTQRQTTQALRAMFFRMLRGEPVAP